MRNRIYKLVFIALVFILVLSLPLPTLAQQSSFVETGIELIPDSEGLKSNSFSTMSSNTLLGLWRYPAEERYWLQMTNATAYFRDVLAGAKTYIYGATDGETWTVDAQLSDGSTIKWPVVTFYANYGGSSNCFVGKPWVICGFRNIIILWYATVQCKQTGLWTMNFYNNSNYLFSTQFTLLPQINPVKVNPPLNQGSYLDAYDSICYLVQNGNEIKAPCGTEGAIP